MRQRAIMAIRDAADNELEDSLRLSNGINWLERNLADPLLEHYIRNDLTPEILGEIKDIDGAIKLAKGINPFRAAHILEDRIKKILIKES